MNKKIVVICSSPRKGGNSEILADVVGTGAGLPGTVKETEAVREVYELGSKI